jgi:proteasome lid subunit RPN8/RPN11
MNPVGHLKYDLIKYSVVKAPNEACGFIIEYCNGELGFIPVENASPEPLETFLIRAEDYVRADARGEIRYVFHSHPNATQWNGRLTFSDVDKRACQESGHDWLLLTLPDFELHTLSPHNAAVPLLGRDWCWGVFDCYGLIRDVFSQTGIILTNYDRGELEYKGDFVWNTNPDWHPYDDYFRAEGFEEIPPGSAMQKYDILLMCMQSDLGTSNHAGIIVDPDRNVFYHHLLGRLSEEAVYGGFFAKCTNKVIRHNSLK